MRGLSSIVILLTLLIPAFAQEPNNSTGTLDLIVALVSEGLEIKPVPKWSFAVVPSDDPSRTIDIATSFSGTATLELAPGNYVIRSNEPLPFDDRSFVWDYPFTITSGERVTLELSNDNAEVTADARPPTGVVMDEGALFQAVKHSVFKIVAEFGHGSGFLVDAKNGLVATNHHVVAESDYLAIKIDADKKYPAKLIVADAVNDIAILQMNPSCVSHIKAVALADDSPDSPPVSTGDRVVAIGSPIATETILTSGLVSKVETGAIYSDVNINPGNSGGPLFSAQREVIGINTFGQQARSGPGIAGIVRIHLLRSLLDTVTEDSLTSPPVAELLPVEPSFKFPAEELRTLALSRTVNPLDYHIEAGKFDVQLVTPVLIAVLQTADEREAAAFRERRSRRRKTASKQYTPGKDFYEWRKYAGDYRAVITVQAVPEIGLTGGSVFAAIMIGASAPQRFKFKADFDRMELWRDDVLVRPIVPGRAANVANFQSGLASMKDVAFYGKYEYPPETFRPGATLTLKVWKQGRPTPIVKTVRSQQHARIWNDFKPYFAALGEVVSE